MSEIQHKSLKAELLYLIGRASTPLSCADLYEKCELAEEVSKVAKALANLQSDGKIVRLSGEGRARYQLADGVAAPAPAGKTGRSKAVQADDAARAVHAAALEIPTLGDAPTNPVGGASAPMAEAFASQPAATKAKVTEMFVDHLTEAGKIADAMLAKSSAQLAQPIRWWIDQDGCLEISDRGDNGLLVEFTRDQARRMAEMILSTHQVLEAFE